jgi:dihydrofolate reductase
MSKPIISLICAISENRAIGKDNKLLWRIPEDLKRFKNITKGHTVIMGRKTFFSIGRPLPERNNIIITSNPELKLKNCIMAKSVEDALKKAGEIEKKEIFIIGGGQVYAQTISLADKLYLTIVEKICEADAFFPEYNQFSKIIFEQKGQFENYHYKFLELTK